MIRERSIDLSASYLIAIAAGVMTARPVGRENPWFDPRPRMGKASPSSTPEASKGSRPADQSLRVGAAAASSRPAATTVFRKRSAGMALGIKHEFA